MVLGEAAAGSVCRLRAWICDTIRVVVLDREEGARRKAADANLVEAKRVENIVVVYATGCVVWVSPGHDDLDF